MRHFVQLAGASLALTLMAGSAAAQWSVPAGDYLNGRGVTAKGDAHLNLYTGTVQNMTLDTVGPRIQWDGGNAFTTVAFEFSMWDLQGVAPYDVCGAPNAPKLRIPIDPITPTADIFVMLSSYEATANGIIDAADIATWNNGPYLEDFIAGVTLEAGVTHTEIEFDVTWSYEAVQRQNLSREFVGFFLDRMQDVDSQVITVQNGGATIVYEDVFIDCWIPQPYTPPAVCFEDFCGGTWAFVEFVDSAYDWTLGAYMVGGSPIDVDPNTGYAVGCSITAFPTMDPAANFAPKIDQVCSAPVSYDVNLSGVSPPVSASNRIRVSVGYPALTQCTERAKEQKLLLYHAPDHVNYVNRTAEYHSNRSSNDDGGWVGTTELDSASPFVVAFADGPSCADVAASTFLAPMGTQRQLGSTLPIKVALDLDGVALTSLDVMAELDVDAVRVRIVEVTTGAPVSLEQDRLRGHGLWSLPIVLDAARFSSGHTYEVRLLVGACELTPDNARFSIR